MARHAEEIRRTQERHAGLVNTDTLPSPTWIEFTATIPNPSDCGVRIGQCANEDRGWFPCTWHLYHEDWDRYCVYRGRVWFRRDRRLRKALGVAHQ